MHNSKSDTSYEFCPRCEANLRLQKGYANQLPYWVCKGCGEMLINPSIDTQDDIVWICDKCEAMLNIQTGFENHGGAWTCTECGFANKIDASEVYAFEDEYQASLGNPYKGLSDAEVLELSLYEEQGSLNGREDIFLVKHMETGHLFVKKYITEYDLSVYRHLKDHPIAHMPRLLLLFEGSNNLVVMEEYIGGKTLSEMLNESRLQPSQAMTIAKDICKILSELHGGEKPIIHRDIKPSNIVIAADGTTFLLDMNVAKWFDPETVEDTKLYGTLYYAAPEQFGYGFSGSSEKTDIYAVGILLNVMLTGKLPKEERADGPVWDIIERCISLNPEARYTAQELILELERL